MELLKSLQQGMQQLISQDVSTMSDTQLTEHRRAIVSLQQQCKKALGQTSTKEHDYKDEDVVDYVQKILEDGFNLKATKLSYNKLFLEAQHLPWWKHIIKKCVQCSSFSADSFNIDYLMHQRSAIEQSTTLHELRQNVKLMIGPLTMYREYNTPIELDYELPTIDSVLEENERLTKELEEKTRVVNEITKFYDIALKEHKDKLALLQAIDAFKVEHNCSDTEACSVFDLSRATLKRLRKELSFTEESCKDLAVSVESVGDPLGRESP